MFEPLRRNQQREEPLSRKKQREVKKTTNWRRDKKGEGRKENKIGKRKDGQVWKDRKLIRKRFLIFVFCLKRKLIQRERRWEGVNKDRTIQIKGTVK